MPVGIARTVESFDQERGAATVVIVVIGAFSYGTVAGVITSFVRFPPFYANVISYALIAIFIKLVFNIADDFFQNIFQSNDTTGATKFIYYYCKMHPSCLKLF